MSVSGETLATVGIYILYAGLLIISINTYIKAPKPYPRGLIGLLITLAVHILYFVLRTIWHSGRPSYLNDPPLAIVGGINMPVYTLLIKPDSQRSRSEAVFMTIVLIVTLTGIVFLSVDI